MTKYLIDASIIASSLEDFKRRFTSSPNCTLILSDLTYKELEARKVDRDCVADTKKFTRFLIDLFVRDVSSTEVCIIENFCIGNHIDEILVGYARDNNMSILTCDKGMALWCRFYNVPCELLETRSTIQLPFVIENNNSLYLNIYNNSVPKGYSVFVYQPDKNKIMSPLENGMIFLNPGYILLVAHPENAICGIDTYYVSKEKTLCLISKDIYASEEDIDVDHNPFHLELYQKWISHMKKK